MIKKTFNSQKELFDHLRTNKKRLIAEKTFKKKSFYISQLNEQIFIDKQSTTKAPIEVIEVENGVYKATLIGNTFNWCDDQMDVLFSGCATKSIKELGPKGKDLIYHLKNHDTDTESRIGYLTDIYEKDFALSDLGLGMQGNTTCLVFESDVQQGLCDNSFKQYVDKKVKQHSIGLQYIKIALCINDANDAEHFANWNKYYQFVINKPNVDSVGYFYAVTEIKLYEVSFVLWGSNELTGVIEESKESNKEQSESTKNIEPINFTQNYFEPSQDTTNVNVISHISKTKYFDN